MLGKVFRTEDAALGESTWEQVFFLKDHGGLQTGGRGSNRGELLWTGPSPCLMPVCHVAGQGRGVGNGGLKLRLGRNEERGGILGFVFASHNPTLAGSKIN